jgi:hypothetical protein
MTVPRTQTMTPAEIERGFAEGSLFDHSAYRLELLDWYTSPKTEERLTRFLAGEKVTAAERAGWLAMLDGYRATGKTIARVHVISEPVSDYLRYELACYESSADHGEDIRILDADVADRLDLPVFDYWLFDEAFPGKAWVAVQIYRGRGEWLGADVSTDPGFVADCRRWRETAMSNAIPLSDYMAERSAA